MRRLYLLTAACFFLAKGAFAAHGNEFIGVTAEGAALGGTGVAHVTNVSDALLRNPALLNDIEGGSGFTRAEIWTKFVNPSTSTNGGLGVRDSQAGVKFLPTLATHYRLSDDLSLALGLLSVGGAAVDQTGQAELAQLQVRNSLIRLVPAVAYRLGGGFTVAAAPLITYGSLMVNESALGTQSSRSPHGAVGLGAQLGVTYKVWDGFVLGLNYISETNLTYSEVMDVDIFGPNAANPATRGLDDLSTQQPQQLGFGVAYSLLGDALDLTAEYRFLNWSQAKGFGQLGWQDQHVIAFGAEFGLMDWTFGAGYAYAQSPIRSASGESGASTVLLDTHPVFQRNVSLLNTTGFPAIAEHHVTAGVGYQFSRDIEASVSFNYAPSVTVTRAGSLPPAVAGAFGYPANYSFTTNASQWAVNAGVELRL